jgi:hypothetical protein
MGKYERYPGINAASLNMKKTPLLAIASIILVGFAQRAPRQFNSEKYLQEITQVSSQRRTPFEKEGFSKEQSEQIFRKADNLELALSKLKKAPDMNEYTLFGKRIVAPAYLILQESDEIKAFFSAVGGVGYGDNTPRIFVDIPEILSSYQELLKRSRKMMTLEWHVEYNNPGFWTEIRPENLPKDTLLHEYAHQLYMQSHDV